MIIGQKQTDLIAENAIRKFRESIQKKELKRQVNSEKNKEKNGNIPNHAIKRMENGLVLPENQKLNFR